MQCCWVKIDFRWRSRSLFATTLIDCYLLTINTTIYFLFTSLFATTLIDCYSLTINTTIYFLFTWGLVFVRHLQGGLKLDNINAGCYGTYCNCFSTTAALGMRNVSTIIRSIDKSNIIYCSVEVKRNYDDIFDRMQSKTCMQSKTWHICNALCQCYKKRVNTNDCHAHITAIT